MIKHKKLFMCMHLWKTWDLTKKTIGTAENRVDKNKKYPKTGERITNEFLSFVMFLVVISGASAILLKRYLKRRKPL
ncbi:hypothetical protein IHC39_002390 [Enterococcus faecalis]|nr:hypothetical protein [Enterococcus faecalis]